jgi:hypothetical protein
MMMATMVAVIALSVQPMAPVLAGKTAQLAHVLLFQFTAHLAIASVQTFSS